jgi:hypothetical protein
VTEELWKVGRRWMGQLAEVTPGDGGAVTEWSN